MQTVKTEVTMLIQKTETALAIEGVKCSLIICGMIFIFGIHTHLDGAPGLQCCGYTSPPTGEDRCECHNCGQLSSVPAHSSYPEKPLAL